jgi:hypothetical protein
MKSSIRKRLSNEHLHAGGMELVARPPIGRELVELCPLKKNEDCKGLKCCMPTVLEIVFDLVRELPRWINKSPLDRQVSRQD